MIKGSNISTIVNVNVERKCEGKPKENTQNLTLLETTFYQIKALIRRPSPKLSPFGTF